MQDVLLLYNKWGGTPVCEQEKPSQNLVGLFCPSTTKSTIGPAKLHLFCTMKNNIHGDQFRDNGEIIKEVKMWVWHAPQDFYNKEQTLFFPNGKKP